MTTKPHNGMCPQMEVFQEVDETGKDTIGAKKLPQGIPVDVVVSLAEVNEGQVVLQVGVGLGPP
jgi:hypothetical protein